MFGLFGKPSRSKFAALVLKKISEAGGPDDLVLNLETFELRGPHKRGFLGNTYAAYCDAKGPQKQTILANFVAMMCVREPNTEVSFEDVRTELVTVGRERALFAFASLYWQLDGVTAHPKQQADALSDWFAKAVVIDSPHSMALVNEIQGTQWSQTPDEIYALGLERLKNSKPAQFVSEGGVFRGTWNDDYDSSRILIPGLFDDLPLRGEPVVAIPNRLTLLVAGSEDPEAIRRMILMAEEIVRTKPRPQNPAPLLVKDGDITDYSVSPDSPIFKDVERVKRLSALRYYSEQKISLEELYQKNGKDLFVASYTLNRLADGTHQSHAVWTKGIPTLLPVTDQIIFVDPDRPDDERVVARPEWKQVQQVLPELMLDTQMFPQRYYVSQFPSAAQIGALSPS